MMDMYFKGFIIQELYNYISINELKNLFHTTKFLKEYKKEYFYWELNELYSHKYYSNIDFYNYIQSQVLDGSKQLSIKLNRHINKIDNHLINISHLENVHTLNLYGIHCITDEVLKHFVNINTLILSCENLTANGLCILNNVQLLILYNTRNITISRLKKLNAKIVEEDFYSSKKMIGIRGV